MTKYIAITGTHSTGKSTFVELICSIARARGLKVATVKDNASECAKAGFGILKDHTFQSTLWIMTTVIREEQSEGLGADLVIVDRPVSDAIGYLEAALVATGRDIPPADREYLYDLAKLHSPRYDLMFKSVLDESITLGPGRDPDLGYRKAVDQHIGTVLSGLEIATLNPSQDDDVAVVHRLIEDLAMEREPALTA